MKVWGLGNSTKEVYVSVDFLEDGRSRKVIVGWVRLVNKFCRKKR